MNDSDQEKAAPPPIEDKAKVTEFEQNKLEHKAFAEAIMSHSVGILTDQGRGVGTGTLVRFGDTRAILTAWHVIEGSQPEDIRFAFRTVGSLHEAPLREFAPEPTPLLAGQALEISRIVRDIPTDIAAVVLDQEQQISPPAALYDASKIRVFEIPDRSTLQFGGFPGDNAIQVGPRAKTIGSVMERVEFDAALSASKSSKGQLTLRYGWAGQLKPHGFSGSAVWGGLTSKSPIWTANLTLVGVVTEYSRKDELIFATNLEGIVGLLTGLST
ncbi:MAG TPA: hypothetical protein VGD60_18080 [Candidatus Acidoferrales bacterium]